MGNRPPLEALQYALRRERRLLVLDIFEQVVAAAPLASTLLDTCPNLTSLVTSREPPRLRLRLVGRVGR